MFLDAGNREKVAEICLWQSLNTAADKRLSLPEYVAAMPEGQDEIYYITGASRAVLEVSPHVESLRRLGVDVLLLTDAVDEWVVQGLTEFDKKKLKPVHKGDFAPPKIKGKDGSDAAEKDGGSSTSDDPML